MKITAGHEELKRVGFLRDYEAGENTIAATINHTPGQVRHIVKKAAAPEPEPGKRTG